MFAIFAGVAWTMVARIAGSSVDDVFDLMFVLFEGFWLLGWSVAVVILGALTVLLFFYGESARLQGGRLVHVPRLGPVEGHHRLRPCASAQRPPRKRRQPDTVRIRFDYDEGTAGLGDTHAAR